MKGEEREEERKVSLVMMSDRLGTKTHIKPIAVNRPISDGTAPINVLQLLIELHIQFNCQIDSNTK
jgi:hypothetical protein